MNVLLGKILITKDEPVENENVLRICPTIKEQVHERNNMALEHYSEWNVWMYVIRAQDHVVDAIQKMDKAPLEQ